MKTDCIPCIRNCRLTLAAVLLHWSGCGIAQAQVNNQAVILQYHHVSSRTPASTSISAEGLRTHMQYLRDNNFEVLPLQDVVEALRTGQSLPGLTAAITFDDGYLSVYEVAYPLLEEFNYPFTIFVTAGLVSSNSALYASWAQLREMGDGPLGVTLANHSMTHPYMLERLPGENDTAWLARITAEIVEAETLIESHTGQSYKLHAYPYGEYDPTIQSLVRELGYVGIGQHSGPISAASDFTALPRYPFSGIYASMNTYPVKVRSLAFNVRVVEPVSPVTSENSPAAILDFEGAYRLDALNCFNNDVPMRITQLDAVAQTYRVETEVKNQSRRFRYNCTAPGPDGRFFWYSIPWVNPDVKEAGQE